MYRCKRITRFLSVILTLTFICSQAQAAQLSSAISKDTLAPSVISDETINQQRSQDVKKDIAGNAQPGAIGNGAPLIELLQGRLPPSAALNEELVRKLRHAIQLAIGQTSRNSGNIAAEHLARSREAVRNLVSLGINLAEKAYLYNSVVEGPEDYLLGFNYNGKIGLSLELIDRLSPQLLAQYIFHECVPERTIIAEGIINRDDHRAIYTQIQSAIFGPEDVVALWRELRDFITERRWPNPEDLPPEKRVIALISGGESAGVNDYFAGLARGLARHGTSLEVVKYGLDRLVKAKTERDLKHSLVWIDSKNARDITGMPGAVAGTARVNMDEKNVDQIIDLLKGYSKTVIIIGGNDHTKQAALLARRCKERNIDLLVMGLPKTIDYDTITYPIGARTAGQNANDMVLRSSPLPGSKKCVVFQSMGRDMGYLTLTAGDMNPSDLSPYSDAQKEKIRLIKDTVVIAIPEWSSNRGVSLLDLINAVREKMEKFGAVTLVVSEGFRIKDDELKEVCALYPYLEYKYRTIGVKTDKHGNPFLAELGIGDFVAAALENSFNNPASPVRYKGEMVRLERDKNLLIEDSGYSIRATMPNELDRVVAEEATRLAIDMIIRQRQKLIQMGGAVISADRRSRRVEDIRTSLKARTFDESIGTTDITTSGIYLDSELDSMPIVGRGIPSEISVPVRPEVVLTPSGMDLKLAIRSINSQSESSLDMRRPNVCVIARDDADEFIKSLVPERRVPTPELQDDRYLIERTGKGLLPLLSTKEHVVPLSDLVSQAYRIYKTHGMLNVIVSSTLLVREDDEVLTALTKRDTALARFLTEFKPDKEGYIKFGRRIVDIIYLALTLVPPSGEEPLSGVRKNILGESLNLLPGEAEPMPVRLGEAQTVIELLDNIRDTIQVTKDTVIVTDKAKFRDETVEYLAFEAALNQNPEIRTVAQQILRETALVFGLKLASIHDFYIAKKEGKWGHITVPAVNGRTDVYHQFQQLFHVAKEQSVGALILELARSEMRYSAQDAAEFTAISIASAIKQGYEGLIFAQGDHYQVNKEKYGQGGEEREKELKAIESLIRKAILAGKYNIDLDPSTLVDESILDKIVEFEKNFVDRYLTQHHDIIEGLDENGVKSVRRRLIDEIEAGKIAFLTPQERQDIEGLYRQMHTTSKDVTMRFIQYIRKLEKELEFPGNFHVSIGVEERHIDNPKHKNNPSTVLGSMTLMQMVIAECLERKIVPPSKISLQTGTMHGVGGQVDFGIYQRHLALWEKIGAAVFVQHGASTLEKEDFDKMRDGDVGEVHLATEYQKIELGVVAQMMPELAEKMAGHLEELMKTDAYKKFSSMWQLAHGNAALALASVKEDDKDRQKKITQYQALAAAQSQKSRHQVISEIVGDSLPKGLKGTLKDLTKELPSPFKRELWNLPKEVRVAVDKAIYEEFSIILEKLGATNTQGIIEEIVPFNRQPVTLPLRPKVLQEILGGITQTAELMQGISKELPVRAEVFKASLVRILSEQPEKTFVLAVDTDIGNDQQNRLQEIFNAIRDIKALKDAKGEALFPNLLVRTNKGKDLSSDITKLRDESNIDLANVFIVGKKENVDNNIFGAIAGEGKAWLAAVDDSQSSYAGYVPVFEAATLTIMAYLNAQGKADLEAVKDFYNAISAKPVDPGVLQDMLKKRVIYILPKITKFDAADLKKLYELAAQVYTAA